MARSKSYSPLWRAQNELQRLQGDMVVCSHFRHDPRGSVERITDPDWWEDRKSIILNRLLHARKWFHMAEGNLAGLVPNSQVLRTRVRTLLDRLIYEWQPMLRPADWTPEESAVVQELHAELENCATVLRNAAETESPGSVLGPTPGNAAATLPAGADAINENDVAGSHGKGSKPGGWTRKELVEEAKEVTSFSATVFDNIRKAACVKAGAKGGAGQQRRFTNAELRKLIAAVEVGPFRYKSGIAKAWRGLLPSAQKINPH